MKWFPYYNVILASKSPRRQQLLSSLGIDFCVQTEEVDEIHPKNLTQEEIPVYLAELKAKPFVNNLSESDLVITADTIVCLKGEIFGKPKDEQMAYSMLQKLSGEKHQVITGVCLTSKQKSHSFFSKTHVTFKKLTADEINYYISAFKPFDKAGAYGIQEWIGSIGIKHIEGSFYNVMGLPTQELYLEMQNF